MESAPASYEPWRRAACLFSLGAASLALWALWAWATGQERSAALGYGYVPMAPLTAWLFLLLSLAQMGLLRWPLNRAARGLALFTGLAVGLYCLLSLAPGGPSLHAALEYWLAPDPAFLGRYPLGRMSPATALGFVACGLALALSSYWRGRRAWPGQAAAVVAAAALLFALLVVLSYALGAPLLYGGASVPMALPTALALALWCAGLLAGQGAQRWLFSVLAPPASFASSAATAPSLRAPLVSLTVLALALAATGYFYLQQQLADARRTARQELQAIVNVKADQLTAWIGERRGDAEVFLNNPLFQQYASQLLADGEGGHLHRDVSAWLESLRRVYGYTQVALYDPRGRPLLGAPWPLPSPDRQGLAEALAGPGVSLTDLHPAEPGPHDDRRPMYMSLWVPVAGGGQGAAGAVQLLVDPKVVLLPTLQAWPTPSPSAEVLLVRREGQEAVALGETRHHHQANGSLRQPLDPPGCLPMANAVLGLEMPEEGAPDHRGVPVLAVSRPVRGMPWFLVAKIDLEEVHAGLRRMAWTTGVVVVVLLLGAAAWLGLFWRQRDNQWLRGQLAMEDQRRELAQRVIDINQQANDIILLVDQDWRILEANQRAEEVYGYGQAELLTMTARDLRAPQALADFERNVANADLRAGVVYETLHQRRDGSLFPVEVSLREVELGGRRYRQSFVRDISERQLAEQERRAHISFLESLARVDAAIKAETDLERMLEGVVREVFDIFQCDRAWLFHPGDPQSPTFRVPVEVSRPAFPGAGLLNVDLPMPPEMAQSITRTLSSQEPTAFGPGQEYPVDSLTAQRFGVQSILTLPLHPKTGQPWIFGMHQCSHPRLWSAQERKLFREIGNRLADGLSVLLFLRGLGESEERFRATFEQAAVGMLHTSPQGRFLRVNQRFADFLGYQPQELLGLTVADVTHPLDLSEDLERLEKLRAGEIAMHWRPKRYLRKDGSLVWGRVTVSAARDEQGQVLYLIAVVEDITEQRLLEAQLRQAQKMEAMGTLAGGIAHDFNNILGAVLGFAEMALEDARTGQVKPGDLEQVIQSALRAKNLVGQILTFSRKSEADLRPLDLNQAVTQARGILERTLPKMIEMETRLAPGLSLVNGDPNQLEQVLVNLATNARDAMPQGGRLIIETQDIHLDQDYCAQHPEVTPGAYVLLAVTDTGHGMDAATREKAFDPFFTTKGVGQGTGLGLSMVYGIVKGHRGHIFCYSEPGLGTCFKIYLPVLQERTGQAPPEAPDAQQDLGGHETVLLVDDEEPLRQVGRRILEGAGYRVLTASSGEEALEVFQALAPRPDLIVMDLGMPGMGGQKCLEKLLAMSPGLKVLIASGYSVGGQVGQALKSGARGFVSKPFRRQELLSRTREVLDQEANPAAS